VPLNLSFTHIMVVLVVALIVLGPDKLPDAARSLARWVGEFRRMSAGLQAEVRDTFGDFAEPFGDLVNTVTGGVNDLISPPTAAPAPEAPASAAGGAALTSLPSLGPTNGPVSPGPVLSDRPATTPLEALAPLGEAEPEAGTFAAFPARPPSSGTFVPYPDSAPPPVTTNGQSQHDPADRPSTDAAGIEPTDAAGVEHTDAAGVEPTG
jgi:sec-independent protein translocase protein TatB